MYGFTSQLRRAALGSARILPKAAAVSCRSRRSASEAEYHFMLARDLDLLHEKDFRVLTREAHELQRMLTALMQRIRSARSAQDQLEARNSQLSPSNLFPA